MGTHPGKLLHRSGNDASLIEVFEDGFTRTLYFGTAAKQSAMSLHAPCELLLPYTRSMMSFLLFNRKPQRILMIGLGGGSIAKFLLHHFPHCSLDIVECSERVVKLAYSYFRLPESPRLRIYVDDAAHMIRSLPDATPYQVVLVDAFTAEGVPESISSVDFLSSCRARLAHGGVLACNLWAGARTTYRETVQTLRKCFEGSVLKLEVEGKGNIIALGTQRPTSAKALKQLGPTATALERRLGYPFPSYLRKLRRTGRLLEWLRP